MKRRNHLLRAPRSAGLMAVGLVLGGAALAGAVTTTDPVTLCIRNGATRVAADDTCSGRETKVQVASATDVAAVAARLDALETVVSSQADALSSVEARVAEVAPPVRPPLSGFGTIEADCGLVASQLDEPTPALLEDRSLDFGDDRYDDPDDRPLLTSGAQTIASAPDAGGSSRFSETFAFEALARCEGASLLKTETEIAYTQEGGPATDMLVEIGGGKVGVSVTRAFTFPAGEPTTFEAATESLTHKLNDINTSSRNVAPEDAWIKQVLVVVASDEQHADMYGAAWRRLDGPTKADTIVYVLTTDGSDINLYTRTA